MKEIPYIKNLIDEAENGDTASLDELIEQWRIKREYSIAKDKPHTEDGVFACIREPIFFEMDPNNLYAWRRNDVLYYKFIGMENVVETGIIESIKNQENNLSNFNQKTKRIEFTEISDKGLRNEILIKSGYNYRRNLYLEKIGPFFRKLPSIQRAIKNPKKYLPEITSFQDESKINNKTLALINYILSQHTSEFIFNHRKSKKCNSILEKIEFLEKTKYELGEDEAFPINSMPTDLKNLHEEIKEEELKIQVKILKDSGLKEYAELLEKSPKKYRNRARTGHSELFKKDDKPPNPSLIKLITSLKKESESCLKVRAFRGCLICLSAALEGAFLHIYNSIQFESDIYKSESVNNLIKKYKEHNPYSWHLSDFLKIFNEGNLLPNEYEAPNQALEVISHIRNCIHPGVQVCVQKSISEIECLLLQDFLERLIKKHEHHFKDNFDS